MADVFEEVAGAQTLEDRRRLLLDGTSWQVFQKALDRPAQSKPRLKKLLRKPGVPGWAVAAQPFANCSRWIRWIRSTPARPR